MQLQYDTAEAHVVDTHFIQASEKGGKVIALKAFNSHKTGLAAK